MGNVKIRYRCVSCSGLLNYEEFAFRGGRCPHCNFEGVNDLGYVDAQEIKIRFLTPWWKFWDRPRLYEVISG